MILITDKTKMSPQELENLSVEFIESMLEGTITQRRYDQIIELLAEIRIDESLIEMIYQGPKAWRKKHFRRFNITEIE